MKKLFILCISIFLIVGCGCTSNEEKSNFNFDHFVYEITSPSGKTDYLFGALRLTNKYIYEVSPNLEKAASDADVYVFEASPLKANVDLDIFTTDYVNQNPLANYASSEMLQTYNETPYLKKYDANLYNGMIIYASELINYNHEIPFLIVGGTGVQSPDKYLDGQAKNFNKDILELEGIDRQIEILLTTSIKAPNYLIEKMINNKDKFVENGQIIRDAYQTGDSETLYNLLTNYESENYADEAAWLKQYLITDRNTYFFNEICSLIDNDTKELISVGVVHLLGDDGLLNMLEIAGYKITLIQ